jgi:ADP-ribosylation factor-like protein 13B
MQFFDLGGGAKIRNIWKNYYGKMHGIVFVVDAADPDRMDEAKEVLHAMLNDPTSKGKPLAIFANKQDLPLAMTASDILLALELDNFPDTEQQVFACSALGQGVEKSGVDKRLTEGIDWMAARVTKRFAEIDAAVKESIKAKEEEMLRRRAEIQKRTEARKAAEKAAKEEEEALASSAAAELPPIVSSPGGNVSGLNPMPDTGGAGQPLDRPLSSSTIALDQPAGMQSPPTPAIPDMDASSP